MEELSLTPLKRWKRVRYITQQIWRQWKKAYLQTLQSREKWRGPTPNIQVGDRVLIKDDSLRKEHASSQRLWPLGLVTAVYPGSDGLVRAVDIKCQGRSYNRAITRLVKLFTPNDTSPTSSPQEDVWVPEHYTYRERTLNLLTHAYICLNT